jgi:hypothetical protein
LPDPAGAVGPLAGNVLFILRNLAGGGFVAMKLLI